MKNSLALLFLFLWGNLYSQEIVIKELCPNHKVGPPNREAAYAYYDKETQKLYLTYMDKTKLNLKTYVNMVKAESYEYARTEDAGLFNQVSDALLKDQKEYYLFFASPSTKEFSVQSIHLVDKSIQRYPKALILDKDEFYMYSFSSQGDYFILTTIRNTSSVKIYRYNFSTKQFEVNLLDFASVNFTANSKEINFWEVIAADNEFTQYDPGIYKYKKSASSQSEVDPKVVSRAVKFYEDKGHLLLTIDRNDNATYLIDIDLAKNDFKYHAFPFQKKGVRQNSYLFENALFQVSVSEESMSYSITDLQTRKIVSSYSCSSEDSIIGFSNSSIYKFKRYPRSPFDNSKETEIKKVKKFLRLCSDYNIFIGARRNQEGGIETIIGSCFAERQGGSNMGPGGIGAPIGSSTVEYTYFFKSKLSEDFASRTSGHIDKSFYDILLDKKNDLTCSYKSQLIFSIDEYYYLGYFYSTMSNTAEGEVGDYYYYIEKF